MWVIEVGKERGDRKSRNRGEREQSVKLSQIKLPTAMTVRKPGCFNRAETIQSLLRGDSGGDGGGAKNVGKLTKKNRRKNRGEADKKKNRDRDISESKEDAKRLYFIRHVNQDRGRTDYGACGGRRGVNDRRSIL